MNEKPAGPAWLALACVLAAAWLGGGSSALARPTMSGLGACLLAEPTDLATNPDGNVLYVADTGNDRVILVSQTFGCEAFVIDATDDVGGALAGPRGVALGGDGRIYVSDNGNDRLLRFDGIAGLDPGDAIGFLGVFGATSGLVAPGGLGIDDDDRVYVADTGNGRVVRFGADGSELDTIGTAAEDDDDEIADGEMLEPVDVAVCPAAAADASAGRIYVADRALDAIHVFEADGSFAFRFGGEGGGPGALSAPAGVAVDDQCNVYVAERNGNRTQMFSGAGVFLEVMSEALFPEGITVATGNGVFVARTGDDTILSLQYIDYDTDHDGLIDSDGDALPDLWEDQGIDLDQDGSVELVLPQANARRKTLYVELDFMGGITLLPDTVVPGGDAADIVSAAFADAPVQNPDGSSGIDLIIERGEQIDHDGQLIVFDVEGFEPLVDFPQLDFFFDNIKRDFFGTAAQRSGANAEDVLLAKSLAYRYGLYVDSLCGALSLDGNNNPVCDEVSQKGGQAEISGNDFTVVFDFNPDATDQAAYIMHELGHNLGLLHGGSQNQNCKPNYVSVMNYMFKPWIRNLDPSLPYGKRLDYSRQALDPLDETALVEADGISQSPVGKPDLLTDWTLWSLDGTLPIAAPGDGPIDWNQDGSIAAAALDPLNITNAPFPRCDDQSTDVLTGFDDWAHLQYGFRTTGNFQAGAHPVVTEEEMSSEDYFVLKEFWDSLFERRFTYSAKFVCVPEVGPEGESFSPGRYRTTINVHNPHGEAVAFLKKAVIARLEGEERGAVSELVEDRLGADEALSINCPTIAARFADEPPPLGDGFVVIKSDRRLDVTAVYTSRDSIDVETIVPLDAEEDEDEEERPEPEPERADLAIELPEPTRVDCLEQDAACTHFVQVIVRNLSAVDVTTAVDVAVKTDNGLLATTTLPGLAGGAVEGMLVTLGPGGNCYDTECLVQGVVDPDDLVPESDETNNLAVRVDLP